jgi:hypothetical protein
MSKNISEPFNLPFACQYIDYQLTNSELKYFYAIQFQRNINLYQPIIRGDKSDENLHETKSDTWKILINQLQINRNLSSLKKKVLRKCFLMIHMQFYFTISKKSGNNNKWILPSEPCLPFLIMILEIFFNEIFPYYYHFSYLWKIKQLKPDVFHYFKFFFKNKMI